MACVVLLALALKPAPLRAPLPRLVPPALSLFRVLGEGDLSPSPTFGPPRRLQHGSLLPRLSRQLISPGDRLVLLFVLEYLASLEATGPKADQAIYTIMGSLGILVGFTWEQVS